MLVTRPGIEPVRTALEVRSLNHWTAREVPPIYLMLVISKFSVFWGFYLKNDNYLFIYLLIIIL